MTTHYDRDTIIDYVHGELTAGEDAVVHGHLAACTDCRALRDEETAFAEALRAAALGDERELPSMVKAKIWDAVRRETPSFADRLRALWRPAVALPAAAAIALVAYLGLPGFHGSSGSQQPGMAAAYLLDEHAAEAQENPFGPGLMPAVYAADTTAADAAPPDTVDTGAAQ